MTDPGYFRRMSTELVAYDKEDTLRLLTDRVGVRSMGDLSLSSLVTELLIRHKVEKVKFYIGDEHIWDIGVAEIDGDFNKLLLAKLKEKGLQFVGNQMTARLKLVAAQ